MKNPLPPFSDLPGATFVDTLLTETVTLEFCFDHITEDLSKGRENEVVWSHDTDVKIIGIQQPE